MSSPIKTFVCLINSSDLTANVTIDKNILHVSETAMTIWKYLWTLHKLFQKIIFLFKMPVFFPPSFVVNYRNLSIDKVLSKLF